MTNRTTTFTVRVTPDELDHITKQTDATGLSKSELARRAIFGLSIKTRKPVADTEALRELAAMGNNLNQLAKAINQGRAPEHLAEAVSDMQRRVTELYHQARGSE